MAGRAAMLPADREPDAGIFALGSDLAWHPAIDPLHWDKPQVAGVGLGRAFARVLLAHRPGSAIGLVPAAVGGSSLDEWQPGGKLFSEAVRRTRAALAQNGKLRGILWHQGEADSASEALATSYDARWVTLIAALRSTLQSPDIPVLVGGLGDFVGTRRGPDGKIASPFAPQVNEQLALLAVRAPRVSFVSSAGLGHKGDELHFDRTSVLELGRRYAYTFLAADAAWPAPGPVVAPK